MNDEATCGAFGVVVSAGGAVIPAEEDHLEVAFDPEFRGKEGAEVAFDGFWGISVGPVPSFGESHDVGVDGESGDVEDVREEDERTRTHTVNKKMSRFNYLLYPHPGL